MTDTIEIKRPDVVRDIRELAERTGKPEVDVVAEAVRDKLGPRPRTEGEIAERRARVAKVLAEWDQLPHDGEPLTDADLYDEDGMPR